MEVLQPGLGATLAGEVIATLTPVAEHTFRVETTDGSGVPGELVVFELDPAGRVTRARFGESYSERIETWEDR